MICTYETQVRVRYGETDAMGVVYYGIYPLYYETGRTEMMRHLGFTYRKMEEMGIVMPVISMECRYRKPARYDDLLTVRTIVREMPRTRIVFDYLIHNEAGELVNEGSTTLVFIDRERERPVRIPEFLVKVLEGCFS
ncbi:MAG: acyl-CoA thioesterase [Marinilabiliales bacterium]|nr:MAG: acyl-CoA thioesterase [Marinilabiliales bacterium]